MKILKNQCKIGLGRLRGCAPRGTRPSSLKGDAPPQNSFFKEKIRVIVGDILVNFENLAFNSEYFPYDFDENSLRILRQS